MRGVGLEVPSLTSVFKPCFRYWVSTYELTYEFFPTYEFFFLLIRNKGEVKREEEEWEKQRQTS